MNRLLIKNGTIVDGSGAPRFTGDVAVEDGKITEMGRKVNSSAEKVIDATGLVVMPGIIDPHTHMDAQVLFEPHGTSSSWAGVTTVYTGMCGYTLAPVRPQDRGYITRMFVRVEEMPLEVLEAGIDWSWETFPQYLDRLDQGLGVNVAPLLGHSPLRYYVMGAESRERKATPTEVQKMAAILKEAVGAGAFGFSTSLAPTQNDWEWRPVPSRQADAQELVALASVLKNFPHTAMGLIPNGVLAGMTPEDKDVILRMALTAGRPIQLNGMGPGGWQWMQEMNRTKGTRLWAVMGCSPGYRMWTLREGTNGFQSVKNWRETMEKPEAERVAFLTDPKNRQTLRDEIDEEARMDPLKRRRPKINWETLLVYQAARPENRPLEGLSMVAIAKGQNKHVADAFLELNISEDFKTEFRSGQLPDEAFFTKEKVEDYQDPNVVPMNTDAGAHLAGECRSAEGVYFLRHWALQQGLFSLEEAVKKVTSTPAGLIGASDRGTLKKGMAADILVFDPNRLEVLTKERAWDMPPGGRKRWVQKVSGIEYVLVNGEPTFWKGKETGNLPGRALRSSYYRGAKGKGE